LVPPVSTVYGLPSEERRYIPDSFEDPMGECYVRSTDVGAEAKYLPPHPKNVLIQLA
jgi:hypothetical protein